MRNTTKVAADTAKKAGLLLRKSFRRPETFGVRYKQHREPVSLIDIASHQLIIRQLQKAFPTYSILSEEGDGSSETVIGKEPTWVIDPLDGTTNFISGIPLFAVAIALVENYVPTIGIVYDPMHDELFVAERGKGAWLNGKRLHVSHRDDIHSSILYAGRGYRDHNLRQHGKLIYALETRTRYFRRLGTATIMLAYVAAGRADSVILTGNKPWDTVAGYVLIQEAGGKVTDYGGSRWTIRSNDLVATNNTLHPEILELIRKTGARKTV